MINVLYSVERGSELEHNLGFNHHRNNVQTPKLGLSFCQSDIEQFTPPLLVFLCRFSLSFMTYRAKFGLYSNS